MFTYRKIISISVCAVFMSSIICSCSSIGRTDENPETDNEATVEYYENLINSELAKALKYELPTSAKMHEPNDTVIRDFGTFDFIIIGAGSTGSVIASRLSEISKWKVLLLEAGKYPNNFTMIPGFFAIQAMTEYNWGFVSTPQKTACLGTVEHRCNTPRGKGVGGTSLINELVYSRGNKKDFDRWADLVKDSSWKYQNLLYYFKKSEDFHKTNPNAVVDWDYHGKGGYLYTNYHSPTSNYTKVFLEANVESGFNITDYNGKDENGATFLQLNTKHGRRFDQATAFIKPVTNRKNLYISHESFAIKIEIDKVTKRTTGVLFTRNNTIYRAKIKKEVIVSTGAFQSPQLLMLSGIGPKQHLKSMNIPLIQDLQVGSTLREHVFCGIPFSSNLEDTQKNLSQQINEYLKGYGHLAASNPIDGAGFYNTKTGGDSDYPDIEMVVSSSSASEFGKKFLTYSDETWNAMFNFSVTNPFTLSTVLLRSRSVGTIRLKSNSPYDYPLIDFNLLSDEDSKDIATIYEGLQFALNLTKTDAFKQFSPQLEVKPLPACSKHNYLSKNFWYCYIRQLAMAAFHPVGTCPAGINPKIGAVVDRNLRVHGIKRLRVADASVFPFTLAGHPNAACTMVGEKISDVIKKKYNKNVI